MNMEEEGLPTPDQPTKQVNKDKGVFKFYHGVIK
jgi:hypothetical protein